jgi:RNA polymerase sigma-70 factor (ECF subfamily)
MTSLPIDRRREEDDSSNPSALDVSDPDPRPREELAQEVRFVLEQLPVKDRTILVLRDLEGFSSAEVAAIVGRREATVRWRLAKARDQFRRLWERRMLHQDQGGTDPLNAFSSEAPHAD